MKFKFHDKLITIFWNWIEIQNWNPILTLDFQSHSNQPNWVAIRIEQSSNPIQLYPGNIFVCRTNKTSGCKNSIGIPLHMTLHSTHAKYIILS